jgi:histidinol dehydrogenase
MIEIVSYKAEAHCPALQRIRSRSLQLNPELVARVAAIVDAVRSGGDEALIYYTAEYDGVRLSPSEIRVAMESIEATARRADASTVEAFRQAIVNVRVFHDRQLESGWTMSGDCGCELGLRVLPVASAGLYVPGGRAAYPSSVIMNTVPAQVAGVSRIAVATPPRNLERTPAVAAVLKELGIQEVYQVGGAQAIAALAFGTESIPRVDKIVGPGNVYVAIAKKLVYGSVGIDSIAGPTEIVILADESASPAYVAADLLAQAEHDQEASAIVVTTSAKLGHQVARELERQLGGLERREIAASSIERYGAIFIVGSIEEGCELVNLIAPEHLELMTANNEEIFGSIENAGAIFFGDWSSEPVGDYLAGPNHVLPTLGTSRFSSPLGVYDFVKRQSIIRYTREAIKANALIISAMADAEGLTAHKRAVMERVKSEE